jgi:WD40 repeat protein
MKILYNKAMREKRELDSVMAMLTQWVTAVKLRNTVNDTGINRTSENLVLRLLNAAYGYDLKNLNWEESNYPAVDLGDRGRGIAFQVTATDTPDKIKETLKRFYAHDGTHKGFPGGIYFFFLKEKPPNLKTKTKQSLRKIAPRFDPVQQMWSMKKLLMKIEELYSEERLRFNKVKEILEEEFGYGNEKISRRKLVEELYRGSKRYLAALRRGGGRFRFLKISDTLLTPTRKNKQIEWLETPVVVDAQEANAASDDETASSVLVAVPGMWRETCCHALLKGEGGMGKTVSYIRLWEQYTAGDNYNPLLPVPVFIPLNEYNETNESGKKEFIQQMIRRFYLDDSTHQRELMDVFKKPFKKSTSGVPSVMLLLDGLNEVSIEKTGLIIEIREILEHWQGVQLIVSSRSDLRNNMGWTDFHLLELIGLSNQQIDKYLREWNSSLLASAKARVESEYPIRELLKNPMMLTIYGASCEIVKIHGKNSQYDFKQRVEMPGDLLWNFIETQVVKCNLPDAQEGDKNVFYKFLLKIMLPALGYEMEKVGRFQLTGDELDDILEHYLKRFCQADFLCTFREYRGYTPAWTINGCLPDKVFGIIKSLLNILSGELSMLVKEGHSYRFLHQNFRDFFAATHILNEISIGLDKKELAVVLKERAIPIHILQYIGEVEGDHYCKPMFIGGKGWKTNDNKDSLLYKTLNLCRGCFDKSIAFAVLNIIKTWINIRGELSGVNLMHLDLSLVELNGIRCSRYYKGGYLAACFDNSLVDERNIFPQGHFSRVNSVVYSPDSRKILSASGDGTIKEWDIETGRCVRTLSGHSDWVTYAVYSPDSKKILSASVDKTIKEWDVESSQCVQTITGHWDNLTCAVYSPDGKKVLSASLGKTIKEWNVETGQCVQTLAGYSDMVTRVFYSPIAEKVLFASWDCTIKELDVKTGRCVQTLVGHSDWVTDLVYSPDGKRVLSASVDKTIKEWDVERGICINTRQGKASEIIPFSQAKDDKQKLEVSINTIKILNKKDRNLTHTFFNIPGLWIQGCSFRNLHSQSNLSKESKAFMRMYGVEQDIMIRSRPLPFIKQYDSILNGPMALSIITKHYGKTYSLQTLTERCFIAREDVTMLSLSDAAESIGMRTMGVAVSFDQLANEVLLPCLAHWRQRHFIVVHKIKKNFVYVTDPIHGKVKYPKQEFITGWLCKRKDGIDQGLCLLMEPTPDFYKQEEDNP